MAEQLGEATVLVTPRLDDEAFDALMDRVGVLERRLRCVLDYVERLGELTEASIGFQAIKPGQTIILSTAEHLSAAQVTALQDVVEEALPVNKVRIFSGCSVAAVDEDPCG